jgi:hypothetical protein
MPSSRTLHRYRIRFGETIQNGIYLPFLPAGETRSNGYQYDDDVETRTDTAVAAAAAAQH